MRADLRGSGSRAASCRPESHPPTRPPTAAALMESSPVGSCTARLVPWPAATRADMTCRISYRSLTSSNSCAPAGSVTRPRVEPAGCPRLSTRSSIGDSNVTQPGFAGAAAERGAAPAVAGTAAAGDASTAVTSAVPPAVTSTVRVTVSFPRVSTISCVPGFISGNVSGVTPRTAPSTLTVAPAGSDAISSRPATGGAGHRTRDGRRRAATDPPEAAPSGSSPQPRSRVRRRQWQMRRRG